MTRYGRDADSRWRRTEPVVVYQPSWECPFTRYCTYGHDDHGGTSPGLQAHLRKAHGADPVPVARRWRRDA